MCKGGQNTTTTSSSANPAAETAYYNLLGQAQNTAATPYQPYTGELTAPVNSQQQTGISGINANANYAQPFLQQALNYGVIGATPLTAAQIQQYSSPYTSSVVDATQNQFNNQNAIQQQGVVSNAVASGAFGGNRVPVAQAVLAGQQQTAQAPVIAGLENQGYTTGLNTALTEQQAAAQGAYSLGNLGVAGQNAALTGANAQVGAGSLEQSTQQAQDQALYQQYINQQAYPFQTEQWLAGIDTGVGSNLGGTSSTTGPPPNQTAQDLGLGIAGVGAAGSLASGLGGSAGLLAALKDGGVASGKPRTIPETLETLHAQQRQLLAGHRRAQLFPEGTKELPLPRGIKKVDADGGVVHYDPDRISAEEIKHLSKHGRENEFLDLGPFNKSDIEHRIRGGEHPLTVVERDHRGVEVRAAGGTVSTAHHQLAAMERTKSPGHRLSIEHPFATLGARLRRASGGFVPSRATGGANYSTFGGGFGAAVTPYSGATGYVPSIGITHGQLPQSRGQSQQPSVMDQMKQIGQLANMFNNKNSNNGVAGPMNLTPQYSAPVGAVMPIGTSPEAYSPTDYSGSGGQIYARGGGVHGYADGGGDDDTFGAPSSGVLPVTSSPPTQAFSQPAPEPINIRQRIIDEAASAGIDPSFALKQAGQESGMHQYNPDGGVITSPKGAAGVGQLMPGTAKDLGVDPSDPAQNVHGMIAYDKQLYDKYGGNYDAVAAAYNAGPSRYDAVLRGERPLPAETAKYVSGITGHSPALHNSPIGWSENPNPQPSRGAMSEQPDSGVSPSGGGFFDKTHNLWPAMMAAGLGMMASRSPFLGNAIGEGGLSGMQVYSNEVAQEHAGAVKQQEIDQAARKLDMEMHHQQSTLDLETRKANETESNNSAKLAEEIRNHTLERNKPIVTYNRDGSQNLISPITGLPITQGPQAPGSSPSPALTPGQSAPQSGLHSGGDYTMSQTPNGGFQSSPQQQPQQQQQGAARPAVFQPVAEKDNIPEGLQPPSSFRDEDYLKTIPADDVPLVRGLTDYQLNPSSFSLRSPHAGVPSERERLISEAARYTTDPKTGAAEYDQTLYPAKQKAVNDFLSGTSPQSSATVMTAGNTAIQHASELYDLVDKIKTLPPDQQSWFSKSMDSISAAATSTGIPYATYAAQQIKNSGLAGTPAGEMLARWADAKQRYSEEVTRFYSGGNGSEAERDRSISLLDPAKSAAELKGSIAQDMTMLRDKVETYNHRLMAGMGPSAWKTALRQDPNLVTVYNSSRNVLDRIGAAEQQRTSGTGQVTPPSQNHPAPADRFKQLRGTGMSAQDAYAQMHKEGYQ